MSVQEEIGRRRTFAIISHPDAGKTTLTEKLLLFGGQIQVAGAVKSNKIKKQYNVLLLKSKYILFNKVLNSLLQSCLPQKFILYCYIQELTVCCNNIIILYNSCLIN